MGDSHKLADLVAELSEMWIGKSGVWAIFDEQKGNAPIIKFLVNDLKTNKILLPKKYKGITIEFEETKGVYPLGN